MQRSKKTITYILPIVLAAFLAALLAFPVLIDMKGEKEMAVGQHETFEDPGASVRLGLGKVKAESDVDTERLGEYTVTYRFLTEKAVRKVRVEDRTRPVIILEGSSEKYLVKGEEYAEAGFSASDDNDGDLTDKVEIQSDLDTEVPGEDHIS